MDAFNPRGVIPRKTRELNLLVRSANAHLIETGKELGMRFMILPNSEDCVYDVVLDSVVDRGVVEDVLPDYLRERVLWSA